MQTYSAFPLNAEESALMIDDSCVGVLVHDENPIGAFKTSPDVHLMLRSLGGGLYFCSHFGPTLAGLANIVRKLEQSQQAARERAMAD